MSNRFILIVTSFSEAMHLLDTLIDRLGPLEEWPTHILQHLFIDHLTPTRTSGLMKIIAFLYGNGVPLKMAYAFYIACSDCTGAAARFAEDQTWE